jgi:hypothetical protein
MSARRDLSFTRGDTWEHTIKFEDLVGAPLDVSGFSWAAQVKRGWSSALLATFSVTVSGPNNSELVLRVDPPDTVVEPGDYRWDLERTSSGRRKTLLAGKFKVVGDITDV